MSSQKKLESFLRLGYFLDYKNDAIKFEFTDINKNKYKNQNIECLEEIGFQLFIKSIDKNFRENKKHVVPLSGGLDSRAILGGLLEFTNASNISTYTYGTPGTLDYEIGRQVAKSYGTNHFNIPLNNYDYNIEELIETSYRVDHQTVLFHHPSIETLDNMYKDKIIWSGFLGETITGDHYNPDIKNEASSATHQFIKDNTYQKEVDLVNHNNSESISDSLSYPLHFNNDISILEQIDLLNRQSKFIAPHVLMRGFKYKIPFYDKDLLNFFFSIDNEYRENQLLYKRILVNRFPELFTIPVKNNHGLPLNSSNLQILYQRIKNKKNRILSRGKSNVHINFINFDMEIRENLKLQNIVKENLSDLDKRGLLPWLNMEKLYKNHILKQENIGSALILLTSLEIHYKAMERRL